MQSNPNLTAIILAKNEEAVLARCLASLSLADTIIVGIDSTSTDSTEQLVRKLDDPRIKTTAIVVDEGFAKAKNTLLAACRTPWCLIIDADETVTPELSEEIASVISQKSDVVAYEIPFRTKLLGRVMQHGGWNETHIRLVNPQNCQYSSKPVHEELIVDGPTGKLAGQIIHDTHRSIEQLVNKINRYSTYEAEILYRTLPGRIGPVRMLSAATRHFISRYIVRQGWRDGIEGLIEAVAQAFNVFIVYAKAWELQKKGRSK